ncbi:MAG TPA: hypothetical protein VK671_12690 [Mucilaginibacter sp.]|jgi:hypothetical protein|nr:hypothetical protein [Mucilaginibacter sp.]
MAIDFYDINDRGFKNRLFCLTEADFEKIRDVLKDYKKRTGLEIDLYGKTRINYDHIKLIIDLLEQLVDKDHNSDKRIIEIKEGFKNIRNDLVAIGD